MEGDELKKIKDKLRSYTEKDIRFHEPHFTNQLTDREGDRQDVIDHIINPDKLVRFKVQMGKYGDLKYALHFKISENRTLILPVIFDPKGKKSLYILTYMLRYRSTIGD